MLERVEAAVRPRPPFLAFIAGIGPGILVMLADTDAGNVVTAAQSGAQWGYRLLPLLLGLIPVLYMVQELAVRLGIFTAVDTASSCAITMAAAGRGSWRRVWSLRSPAR